MCASLTIDQTRGNYEEDNCGNPEDWKEGRVLSKRKIVRTSDFCEREEYYKVVTASWDMKESHIETLLIARSLLMVTSCCVRILEFSVRNIHGRRVQGPAVSESFEDMGSGLDKEYLASRASTSLLALWFVMGSGRRSHV